MRVKSFRNFSALDVLYHVRCPMRFSSYVYRQRSRENAAAFLPTVISGGRIGGAAKREEVVPTDSQFLQAQGLLTSFVLKYKGPGHIISRRWEGELAVPRSGRRSFRPTANFSRPRDSSHRLSSNIEALGTLYHTGGRENWRCREAGGGRSDRQPISPGPGTFPLLVCLQGGGARGILH